MHDSVSNKMPSSSADDTTPSSPVESPAALTPAQPLPPAMNRPIASSVSQTAMSRLHNLAPVPDRCLITLDDYPLEVATVLPRTTSMDELRQLEHAWGMKERQLRLDSSWNLLYLRVDMQRMFDESYGFALLPALSVLKEVVLQHFMFSPDERPPLYSNLITSEMTHWDYHLVPFGPEGISRAFLRYDLESYASPTVYQYPFDTLPPLRSHIHPFFAILDAAKKWRYQRARGFELTGLMSGYREHLAICENLYAMWLNPRPSPMAFPKMPSVTPSPVSTRRPRKSHSSRPVSFMQSEHTDAESSGPTDSFARRLPLDMNALQITE